MSTTNSISKTHSGLTIETKVLWQQSFNLMGRTLQLSLSATPMTIIPPVLLLNATCGDASKQFNISEGLNANVIFPISGSGAMEMGARIEFSNWSWMQQPVTAHLNIVGYEGLVLQYVANETITLKSL